MRTRSLTSILLILMATACLDRVFIDVGKAGIIPIVIDGHISNKPGPYQVTLFTGHDLENKLIRHAVSAKQLTLSDNVGNSEVLSEVDVGIYRTALGGIQGMVGRVYKLRIELFDGRIYESQPDSLLNPGKLDSLYYDLNKSGKVTELGYDDYGFDIFFNSSAGPNKSYHFLWKFTGTFQAETYPRGKHDECFYSDGKCQFVPPCSGYKNVGGFTPQSAVFEMVGPCTCCTCWYNLFNDLPILSDNQLLSSGRFIGIKAYRIPIDRWIFSNKIHVQVEQFSLSKQSFDFWRAIKNQRTAIGSLFQPVTGKVPSNFTQIEGPNKPIDGLFFATSISSKSFFLTKDNLTNPDLMLPDIAAIKIPDDCIKLFPNASYKKPIFWE